MTSQRTLRMKIRIPGPVPFLAVLTVLIAPAALAQQADKGQPSTKSSAVAMPAVQAKVLDSYGKLPLSFEANHGQADGRVKFLSRTGGYSLFLTEDEAVLALRGTMPNTRKTKIQATGDAPESVAAAPATGSVLRMKLRNANSAAKATGVDELAGTTNCFIGNDPTKWRTNVPTYAKVKYEGVYSGIDLVYYGNQRQLEYDFIVAPGADPHRIAFDVRGAKRIRQDGHGELILKMSEGEIRWHKPVVYQEKDGARQEIAAHYAITAANRVTFELAKYDASRPLYIDPLVYSTYLGGSSNDYGSGIAVDSAGNAYVTGQTNSTNFPVTPGALQTTGDAYDAFVAKINPEGSALVYSTYLGGSDASWGAGIAVDNSGDAYIIGSTNSTDFPTMNALQPTFGGGPSDAFVAKINPSGSALLYSSYLGGSSQEFGSQIAVDRTGNAYVTGQTLSTDFPTTPGAFQRVCGSSTGCWDAFVAKINPTGSAFIYSTYLGGSGIDDAFAGAIAADDAGNAYVTGDTGSTDFPTLNPLQSSNAGAVNAYVTKINPTGSALVYSTYLGGSKDDWTNAIAVDGTGNVYLTGQSLSSDFPTTPGAFQTANGGLYDAFVVKINSTGSALVYSTYLGGLDWDQGNSIAVDSTSSAYVTGWTLSPNFPTASPLQKKFGGHHQPDAFVSKISPTGSVLAYSTFLGGSGNDSGGGIAVDSTGNAYVTGSTNSTDFPTENPLQPANAGESDAFVAKILNPVAATSTALVSNLNPSTYGQAITFTATVTSIGGIPSDSETVIFYNGLNVLGTAPLTGGIASLTISTLKSGIHTISAAYLGDANFTGSTSPALRQVVDTSSQSPTATSLASSLNPSIFGQKVTWTATVTTSGKTTPTGKVNFNWGSYSIGTATLNSSGVATFTRSNLNADAYPLFAVYVGDTNNGPSVSAIANQVVRETTSAATLSSSVNPSTQGQAVTFTATITSPTVTATGPVTFTAGTTVLGTAQLSDHKATFTTSTLPVGSTTVTATYNGDSNIAESSASVTQTVQQ